MKKNPEWKTARRQLIKLVGGGIAFATVGTLVGCSDGEQTAAPAKKPAAESKPEPAPAAPETATTSAPPAETSDRAASPPSMAQLSEDNPQAMSLGYKHDAETVDTSKFANYKPGQICAGCSLYGGDEGDEWGSCAIFAGKMVNANGWCSAFVAKPS